MLFHAERGVNLILEIGDIDEPFYPGFPQIDHDCAHLGRRLYFKNQYIAAKLGALSWRARWVKRNWSLSGSIATGASVSSRAAFFSGL